MFKVNNRINKYKDNMCNSNNNNYRILFNIRILLNNRMKVWISWILRVCSRMNRLINSIMWLRLSNYKKAMLKTMVLELKIIRCRILVRKQNWLRKHIWRDLSWWIWYGLENLKVGTSIKYWWDISILKILERRDKTRVIKR